MFGKTGLLDNAGSIATNGFRLVIMEHSFGVQTKLPWLIGHSHRTLAIIRQNITFALAVKTLFVILTFAGYASLWAAIAADMGASLLVIFNGLRLLR